MNFSPANGQNIVDLLAQLAKKWCPHRESFHCLVHELDGSIEVAVCRSYYDIFYFLFHDFRVPF